VACRRSCHSWQTAALTSGIFTPVRHGYTCQNNTPRRTLSRNSGCASTPAVPLAAR
jgi:hypothetical protein